MTTLCHIVSGTIAACAALGAATFAVLWGRNGFRGLPDCSGPVRRPVASLGKFIGLSEER